MARTALECLLCQIQGKPAPFSTLEIPRTLQLRSSIRMRKNSLSKIFVAGYLNTDIVLATDRFPQHGQTQVTSHVANFVGGKGANLAYGVAHLGGNVCLAGRLGSDRRGRFIYDHLSQAGVKMDGVSFDSSQPTGTAYISLFPTGSSTVLIDPGANQSLTASDMEQARYLLQDAKYCLLQTDIPMNAVLKLHEMCAESRIPTILCPAYVHEIPARLLDGLFMLAVTRSEMARIYPQFQTMEEQADYLLNQGVQNAAIVDLEAGCLWATRESRVHFPPYAYPCADKTGMIDVFIASLATLLSENFPMEDAIFASYWACAYGTMKIGVQEGFPDWSVLVSVLSRDITVHPE